jgi:peptide/nickel transport system permease protein
MWRDPRRAICTDVSMHPIARSLKWFRTASKSGNYFGRTYDKVVVFLWLALAFLPWGEWFISKVRIGDALKGPSLIHPLGTDNVGRDLLVRISDAIHTSVLPLWLSSLIGVLSGIGLALWSISLTWHPPWRRFFGFFNVIAVIVTAIPAGVMAFAWGAFREKVDLQGVLWTLTLVFAFRMYLLIGDLNRRDYGLAYWKAHEALGGSPLTRIWRYGMCGGWTREISESISLNLRVAVAIEAAVSYLGFGVTEPAASFGNMLATHFDSYLKGHMGVVVPIILGLGLTARFPVALLRLMRVRTDTGRKAQYRYVAF